MLMPLFFFANIPREMYADTDMQAKTNTIGKLKGAAVTWLREC